MSKTSANMVFLGESCPICRAPDVQAAGVSRYYDHVLPSMRCSACGSYFHAWHQSEWMREYWGDEIEYAGKWRLLHEQNVRQRDFVLRHIEDKQKSAQIVDVGCGPGFLLDELSKSGIPQENLVGVDIKGGVAAQARKTTAGVEVVHARFEEWARSHEGFADMLILSHILEHIVPPYDDFLGLCGSVLRPGGLLLVEVPHCDSEVGCSPVSALWKTHVVSFSPRGLAALLQSHSFAVKDAESVTNMSGDVRYAVRCARNTFRKVALNPTYKVQALASCRTLVRLLVLELPLWLYRRFGAKPRSPGYIIIVAERATEM